MSEIDELDTYMCWNANEQSESDAKAVKAESWKEAAATFAEHDFHEEPFDEIEVRVRLPNGKLGILEFEAEQEVHFYPGLGRLLKAGVDPDATEAA